MLCYHLFVIFSILSPTRPKTKFPRKRAATVTHKKMSSIRPGMGNHLEGGALSERQVKCALCV